MRRVKRAISCFLALVLVISNLPMNVLAEELSNEPTETIAVVNEAPTEPKETEMPTEFQETAAPLETAETAPEAIEETTETAEVTEDTIPVTEETLPEVTEEAIYTLTEQQRSLILSRDDGQWLFPLPQEYYANITDWNGCRGESACLFCGEIHSACTDPDHADNIYGHWGLEISVPAGTEVYAPRDGVAYWTEDTLIIEHPTEEGNAYYTVLAGLNSIDVSDGSEAAQGDVIACSGEMLHFAIFMAPAGEGAACGKNPAKELTKIEECGWLEEKTGTGMIVNSPSALSQKPEEDSSDFGSELKQHLGTVQYCFEMNMLPASDDEEVEETTESTNAGVEVTEPADHANVGVSVASDFLYTVLNGTYCEVTDYIGTDTAVEIPTEIDGYIVQSISGNAFKDNTALTAVVLPSTLETIGTYAFSGCTSLSSVTLNSGLTTIADRAFENCSGLKSITIPDTVTSISGYTFTGCTGLTEVDLPEGLTDIKAYAFQNCTSLVSIDIPDSVTTLAARAFYNCTKLAAVGYPASWSVTWDYNNRIYYGEGDGSYRSPFEGCTALTKVEIPEGVTEIPKHAFRYHTALEEVVLPESLTAIGVYAFDGCTGLKTAKLNAGLTDIKDYAFRDCKSLTTVAAPETLTAIGESAYSGCTGLTSVALNSGVTEIAVRAFENCSGLKSITIPDTVTSISGYTFTGCTGLTEVDLPAGLTDIKAYAFQNCTSLVSIDIPDSVTTLAARAFYNCTKLVAVGYPASWSVTWDYNNRIYYGEGDGGYRSPFEGCTALTKVEIPEGVTEIPKHAFRYHTALEEVVLPESLTAIGVYAFDGCTGLKTAKLNAGLTDIKDYAFRDCKSLTTVTVPETLKTIGESAYSGCTGLNTVTLNSGVTEIAVRAFENCSGLKSITIPDTVTSISGYTFTGCTGLTEVNLPAGLTDIKAYAFQNCTSLVSIDIPDSVTTLAARAFYNCTKLVAVGYPASWSVTWDYNNRIYYGEGDGGYRSPFEGCTALTKVEIPEGVTEIPKHAFRYHTALEEVVLPESLTAIGVYAFDGCTSLEKIWIDQGVTSIGGNAFANCPLLTIHGPAASYAEDYAAANGIPFSTEAMVYPTSSIQGQVMNENGVGIANVVVTLFNSTKAGIQDTVYTDENGEWSYDEAYIGHSYRVTYYHADYNFAESTQEYTIGEDPITAADVVGRKKSDVENTDVSDFTYTILNGTYCQITGYTGDAASIRVPAEINGHIVQSIAENAFRDNTVLETVVFPVTVETIGTYVFSGCTSLADVRLNHGLTQISGYAFNGCSGLADISLPSTITSIQAYAFQNCTSLETIAIPDSVTTLAARAFYNCTKLAEVGYPASWSVTWDYNNRIYYGEGDGSYRSPFEGCTALTKVEIPEGVTEIPKHAFRYHTALEEVVLPESLTAIGVYAFDGCTGLKTAKLNAGLTDIKDYAFRDCKSLTTVAAPETLTAIGESAYSGCTGLTSVALNSGVTEIAVRAFENCSGLKSITIPDTVTSISGYTFTGCTGLTEVDLPEGLTDIKAYAFQNCTSLVSIDIPDSVTTLAARAFYNCTKLAAVGYPASWSVTWDYNNRIYYGEGDGSYRSPFEGCTALTKVEIPEGVTEIPKHAFRYHTALEEVVLPESLTAIGVYAFDGCTGLKTAKLNAGLTDIKDYAFRDCKSLTTVAAPETLTAIGESAYSGCTGLTSVALNSGVTEIAVRAFENCSGLKSITIPDTVTSISGYTFTGCTGLTEVNLPAGLTDIKAYAFQNCTSLETIAIPDSVTTLAARAFYNCTKLAAVGYPASWSVTWDYNNRIYYGEGDGSYRSPFEGCTALTKVEIPEGVTEIPKHAFRYVTALEEVVLPESLNGIGVYAFDGCTGLKTINLVEGIQEIPAYCFNNCTGMNYLTLPDSLETVGDHAFNNCIGLRSVSMGSGLKTIGRYAFYGCQGLVSLFMGGNVETISEYAFAECINVKSITLPANLVTIGDSAFANCVKVSELIVPDSVTSIVDNAFRGVNNLIFCCSMNSYAAVYAIDHHIPIIDTEESGDDNLYLDRQNSYYRVNGDGVSASGFLVMVAKYAFNDSVSAKDIKLTFNIPGAVELDESTLTVDGVLCTDYTFVNNVLTVPVTNTSGTVRFLLKPLNYDRVTAYCKISFHDGQTTRTEILGTIYTEIPILSITSPSQTSNTSVRVSGVTMPNSEVTLYVNGSEYTTVRSNRVGDYSASISFASPSNGKKYTIRAEVRDSYGSKVTAETSTVYRVSIPVLTEFIMEYGGKTYNLRKLAGTKPNIVWRPGYQYKFTVRFKNVESISSVCVVSTRNNVKKYMRAQWSEEEQAFIAEGFFDNSKSYVPGIISLEYVRRNGTISFEDGYDFSSEEACNEVPEQWKDANVIICENTDERTEVIIERNKESLPDSSGDEAIRVVTKKHKIGNISEEKVESLGYSKVTDTNGQSVYAKVYSKDGKYWASVVDSKTGDAVEFAADLLSLELKNDGTFTYHLIDGLGDVGDFLDLAEIGIEGTVNTLEYGRMKQNILNSNLSNADKEIALKKLNDSIMLNTLASLVRIEMVVAGAVMLPGAAVFGPVGVTAFLALLTMADMAASQLQEMTMMQMNSMMYMLLAMGFTWAIDPSGFVYDSETGKPILEAAVTAYWIPFDENDADYWDEKPSAEEYGEIWDASGFSQENPLTTDISGWYAWDVPEGWWRVKSERFGYETAWSDWVPVPPPQMDVHIGMTPLDNCGYCGKDVIWILDEVGVLTISGTGDMADYSADTPAPWHEAASGIAKVVIEEGVTGIGRYAFKDCTALNNVTLPVSLSCVGEYAFSGCEALQDVHYSGTEADREGIRFGVENARLEEAVWHCTDPNPEPVATAPMYRMYNPYSQEHLLVSDKNEVDNLVANGWKLDGVAWYSPATGAPVYRLYNKYTNLHFYTMNRNEADSLVAAGWLEDGVVCYSADVENGTPVYRLYNQFDNVHLFTISDSERELLLTAGWNDEGVAWYAAPPEA